MVQNAIKKRKKLQTHKNNTILTPRVDIPFWTLLIFSRQDDIQ